jgi:hypothetical protein
VARRPWPEQYGLHPAVSECSSEAARTRELQPAGNDISPEAENTVESVATHRLVEAMAS